VKVLLDRNLRHLAIRAQLAVRSSGPTKWGSTTLASTPIHGITGKALPSDEWKREQLTCLATIGRLAREGRIEVFTCTEIGMEEMNAATWLQNQLGDIFFGVKIDELPSAVERSYFHQTIDFSKYASGDATAEFVDEFLLKVRQEHVSVIQQRMKDLPAFDLANLQNVERFRELCKGLGTKDHRRDAFHLWTAEVHFLDYFLTGDKRFVNAMTQSKRMEFVTRPVTPVQLLGILGLPPLDPIPLADGRFYHLHEQQAAEDVVQERWRGWLSSIWRAARITVFRTRRAVGKSLVQVSGWWPL